MNEITIVTAFININRENWSKFGRSEQQYFEYFKVWGKLKNRIVAYVESEDLKDKIESYRKSLKLESLTEVVLIDNFMKNDIELYKSIEKITNNKEQIEFRTKPNNPEVINAKYDYIMMMKMWCVNDAIINEKAHGLIAWVDFGYLHGGKIISEKSDFNFEWKYPFDYDKFHLFTVQDLNNKPIFKIVQEMDTYIMGTVLIGNSYNWPIFWNSIRSNMISLNKCGLVDDDQTIILMSYRDNPDFYQLHKSDWDMQLKQFGGDHLLLNDSKKNKTSFIKKCLKKIKNTASNLNYSKKMFKKLQKLERK